MANVKLIICLIFIFLNYSITNITQLNKRVAENRNIYKKMNGVIEEEVGSFHAHNFDDLLYPRRDKHKLAILTSLWRDYYDCLLRSVETLTSHQQVPSTILMVYAGAVARLTCPVCIAPGEIRLLKWMFSKNVDVFCPKSTSYMIFSTLKENERMVREVANLTIYNVKASDAGVYRCHIGTSSSLVVVEVVDTEEEYDIVKPYASGGPYASPHCKFNNLTIFTSWSSWSKCTVCGKVGRRQRYGLCYVKMDREDIDNTTFLNTSGDPSDLLAQEITTFEAFPDGIPCRSSFLPKRLSQMSYVQKRRSEIMIAMCKVPCKVNIYEALSSHEMVPETADNNTAAGIYSLKQVLTKQPSLTNRDIIFTHFGQRVCLRCPGTILRDVPYVWRSGTKLMMPRETVKASGGRVYINPRGHLIITNVMFRDANIYSCWQDNKLAGTIKLKVGHVVGTWCNHHVVLLLLVIAASLLARICFRVSRRIRHTVKDYA